MENVTTQLLINTTTTAFINAIASRNSMAWTPTITTTTPDTTITTAISTSTATTTATASIESLSAFTMSKADAAMIHAHLTEINASDSIGDYVSSVEEGGRSVAVIVLLSLVVFLIFVISLFGNLLVIVCIRWDPRLRNEMGNAFLVNLSLTDMTNAAVVMSSTLASIVADGPVFPRAWCDLVCVMNYVLIIVSMLTLCYVSVDRHTAVLHPMTYHVAMTKRKVLAMIAWAWAQGLAFGLFPALARWVHYDYWEMVCAIDWASGGRATTVYVLAAFTSCFVAPAVVLIVAYTKVMIVANGMRIVVPRNSTVSWKSDVSAHCNGQARGGTEQHEMAAINKSSDDNVDSETLTNGITNGRVMEHSDNDGSLFMRNGNGSLSVAGPDGPDKGTEDINLGNASVYGRSTDAEENERDSSPNSSEAEQIKPEIIESLEERVASTNKQTNEIEPCWYNIDTADDAAIGPFDEYAEQAVNGDRIEPNGNRIEPEEDIIKSNGDRIEPYGDRIQSNGDILELNGNIIENNRGNNGDKIESNGGRMETNGNNTQIAGAKRVTHYIKHNGNRIDSPIESAWSDSPTPKKRPNRGRLFQRVDNHVNCSSPKVNVRVVSPPSSKQNGYSASTKAIRSLLIVVVAFFICMTPFCITKVYKVIQGDNNALPGYVNVISTVFQYCSSAINPLIYGVFRRDFRRVFNKVWRCILCREPYNGASGFSTDFNLSS